MASTHRLHLRRIALLFGLAVFSPLAHPEAASISKEFIYTSASFPSAHASTLVQLRDGDLLAAWFSGSHENAPDVAIWGSRRTAGHWSTPFLLVREPNIACWNPVLFHSADGKLWLYYKFGPSARTWTGARLVSNDDGKTWSRPEHLPAGLLGPIKDKPLVLPNGTIVSGTSVESYSSWAAWIDRSTDNGRTWQKIGPITVHSQAAPPQQPSIDAEEHVHGIIQPTIVSLGREHLRLYARSSSDIARICMADSFDNGLTWTQAHPTDLPNPNSGIDAVGLRDGRIVVIFNNSTKDRTPLNLAISADGEHFKIFATLEDQPGEYSYPAIIQDKDGNLDTTYTWNRKRISFASVPLPRTPASHQDAP
jgi:predicted neuraminidase